MFSGIRAQDSGFRVYFSGLGARGGGQVLEAIMGSVAHPGRPPLAPGDRAALLVNSLGGTPALELAFVANAAVRLARSQHQVCPRAVQLFFTLPSHYLVLIQHLVDGFGRLQRSALRNACFARQGFLSSVPIA